MDLASSHAWGFSPISPERMTASGCRSLIIRTAWRRFSAAWGACFSARCVSLICATVTCARAVAEKARTARQKINPRNRVVRLNVPDPMNNLEAGNCAQVVWHRYQRGNSADRGATQSAAPHTKLDVSVADLSPAVESDFEAHAGAVDFEAH